MTPQNRNRKGFTLIELLTVIAIIGILAAVLFPGVQGVMRSAKKNSALNKLRSIGQGYLNWSAGGKVMTRTGTWVAGGNVATKVSEYAANLAIGAELNSGELWFVDGDELLNTNPLPNPPKNVVVTGASGTTVDPLFTAALTTATASSWDVYSGTSTALVGSVAIPLAWSRALTNAGTWPAATGSAAGSCWGVEGGHIVYGDGHVLWVTNTQTTGQNYFTMANGTPTADWKQSRGIPATAAVLPQQ